MGAEVQDGLPNSRQQNNHPPAPGHYQRKALRTKPGAWFEKPLVGFAGLGGV
jgi:hypothetical protein